MGGLECWSLQGLGRWSLHGMSSEFSQSAKQQAFLTGTAVCSALPGGPPRPLTTPHACVLCANQHQWPRHCYHERIRQVVHAWRCVQQVPNAVREDWCTRGSVWSPAVQEDGQWIQSSCPLLQQLSAHLRCLF